MEQWWNKDIEYTVQALSTDINRGLDQESIKTKLAEFGPNKLRESKGPSALSIFVEQFQDFIVWVLTGAALVSGFLREWVDALAIIAIIILNAILGFIQEFRAEKSLAALKKLSSPFSKVIRDGQSHLIPSSEIVPGDLIELEAGDNVPADSRIVWLTSNFSAQEASLTGESNPVFKTNLTLNEEGVPLAERANMAYFGTSISSGKARAIVTETGMNTELGKIAGMIQDIPKETTPLQKKLDEFGRWIVYLCFVLVGMVFFLEWLRGGKLIDVFLTAVSLAVAAIPEGLPAVVTIALALGVQRMVKRHALIRKLPSVETLGCATVICSDKTGTLTKNEMTVRAIYAGGNLFQVTGTGYEPKGDFSLNEYKIAVKDFPDLIKTLDLCVLCNGARITRDKNNYKVVGDPTEGALLTAAAKAGISRSDKEKDLPFLDEIPFDSQRKMMTMIRGTGKRPVAFVKGAPDVLLKNCEKIEKGSEARTLTNSDREEILKINDTLAGSALRVLAVAYRELNEEYKTGADSVSIERGLTFMGLVAMIDPPREEVRDAIAKCKAAGIKTVMITGDHKNTAVAVAKELGFFSDNSIALTGEELDAIGEEEFASRIEKIPVYARVSPEHKLRIVRAWKRRGDIVAMTGDGVNDAPALKESDIGIAMGITGTDVTKEVSDMVITDDNFASIVSAIEEGRGIYDNIKKFIHYLLSCNAGEILVMFTASLIGLPTPLLPIHILWINLVTDGFPALALGVDPVSPDIMERMPRHKNEGVLTKKGAMTMLTQGSFIAFCSLLAFVLVLFIEKEGLARARTAAFIVLSCSQLFHSFNCRSAVDSLFKIGIFTNKKLIFAALISFFLQMSAVYVPFAQKIFKTEPLGLFDWVLVITISSFPLWAMEIVKAFGKIKKRDQGI